MTKHIALIVAAGRGTRAVENHAGATPKQYVPLNGIPVLRHTLEKFTSHPAIDHVLVVIHADDREAYEKAVDGIEKILPAVEGKETRQGSVLAGLQALEPLNPKLVLIHDAARPLVSRPLIDRVLAGLKSEKAVIPALAVTDTLRKNDNGYVGQIVPRDKISAVQTPQGFCFESILSAHKTAQKASQTGFTDDSEIAVQAGLKVKLVEGDRNNIKITMEKDFTIAQHLLEAGTVPMMLTIGSGFDVHKFGPGDHVTLCGVAIPHGKSLIGHSDADVGLHALVDAILGALADGDIGSHFPPDEARWKGAGSDIFLRHAADLVANRAGEIKHLDVTLVCENPKISPHRDAMRRRIAGIVKIPLSRISVKATTTEGLGFTGRGEGIAAQGLATLSLPDREKRDE